MLLCSCVSFDIGDWPSPFVYPHNAPSANWCGAAGAFFAYYLFYYIGPGVFILLVSAICFLVANLASRKIGQPILRVVGLLLLTAAASCTWYCLFPKLVFSFPFGSGGILGVGLTTFLLNRFAQLGTFILLSATWLVGAVLLADSLVIAAFIAFGHALKRVFSLMLPILGSARSQSAVLSEIWQKLSSKQKEQIRPKVTNLAMHIDNDEDLEESLSERMAMAHEEIQSESDRQEHEEQSTKPKEIKITSPLTPKPVKPYIPKTYDDYVLPPMELLSEAETGYSALQGKVVKAKAVALEKLLSEFNVNAGVVRADTGPVVTMYELELGAGVKVSQISSLSNDIARALGASAVRVVAPLPGKHTIGIEVPNNEKEKVRIKDLMRLAGVKAEKMAIPLFLGKDSSGEALVSDLASMPHLLIAGTTGSGKSVCINSIITSILMTRRPDEVKMILVDPKMVEMSAFNNIPHLMSPIVTETNRAVQILEWATVKMDERYAILAEARVKNIADFNKLGTEEIINRFNPTTPDEEAQIPKKLPLIMIVIDELADLMMTASKEIETYIVRLAQKSRAVGIHIVLATQRPQATVVTGLIKSNMPCRIGFRVAARMDSRIILDQNGAETLLGQGDMLFLKPGTSDLIRAQGTFMDDDEIKNIVNHLKTIAEPQFHPELTQLNRVDTAEMSKDDLFDDGVRIVLETKRGSVSLLQRRLAIGYARASRIIEMMAAAGILGEYKGSQAREVLVTLDEYEQIRKQMLRDAAAGYADMTEDDKDEPAYVSEGQQGYMAVDEED